MSLERHQQESQAEQQSGQLAYDGFRYILLGLKRQFLTAFGVNKGNLVGVISESGTLIAQ